MRIILKDIEPDDFALSTRAARWLINNSQLKDSIVSVPDIMGETDFYVKRGLSSITVRYLNPHAK